MDERERAIDDEARYMAYRMTESYAWDAIDGLDELADAAAREWARAYAWHKAPDYDLIGRKLGAAIEARLRAIAEHRIEMHGMPEDR